MSYDLGVFYSKWPITTKDALERYAKLGEGEDVSRIIEPSRRIKAFINELNKNYPQIDEYSDDEVDNCPWSCMHDISKNHVIMSFGYPRAEEMVIFIACLARKYGLVCVDPQEERIWYAPHFESYGKLNEIKASPLPLFLILFGIVLNNIFFMEFGAAILLFLIIAEIKTQVKFHKEKGDMTNSRKFIFPDMMNK